MDIKLEILGIQAIKKVLYKTKTAKTRIDLALIKFILYIIMPLIIWPIKTFLFLWVIWMIINNS